MTNYYEILEVGENASQEVIERVYKLFAKKYHPDVNPDNPKEAEEKFKLITEAYEVLSDEFKRKEYDERLKAQRMIDAQANSSILMDSIMEEYNMNNSSLDGEDAVRIQQEIMLKQQQDLQKAKIEQENKLRKEYNDAYISALERAGIHVVYKKTWQEKFSIIKSLFFTIVILTIVCIIVWHIPYTHRKIMEIYNNSGPLKSLVEVITNNRK